MKQIRIKINDLLDTHKGSFYECKGCDTCTEIQRLSKLLERDPVKKFQYILDKRSEMTKSDIAFLIEQGVQIKKIRAYAGIPHQDFYQMMKNYGFSQEQPNRGRKKEMPRAAFEMKVSDYLELRAEMNKREIAKHLGISEGTLYSWISKNENEINAHRRNTQPNTAEKKPSDTETTKENKTAEYEAEIRKLTIQLVNQELTTDLQREQIEKLQADLQEAGEVCKQKNSEAAELRNKLEDLENVNAACDDVENESARFKEERDNYLNQLLDSRDKLYRSDYTVQNQKKIIEDIKKTLERYEKENKALRELVGLWI